MRKAKPDAIREQKNSSHIPAAELGCKDSNLEMLESESSALPFGDNPMYAISATQLLYISIAYFSSPRLNFFPNKAPFVTCHILATPRIACMPPASHKRPALKLYICSRPSFEGACGTRPFGPQTVLGETPSWDFLSQKSF